MLKCVSMEANDHSEQDDTVSTDDDDADIHRDSVCVYLDG